MLTQLLETNQILVRETVPSSDTVRERFAIVDGLRAVAIVAVLFYEVFAFVPALARGHAPLALALGDASQGFALFLLLSGFTLGYPAIAALTESACAYLDIARFAIKRVVRIYPAYLVALGLAFALPQLVRHFGVPALAENARPIGVDSLLRNAVFIGNGLGNDGFRALALVARAYVFFPLLLLLWSRSARAYAGVGIAIAVLDTTTGLHALGLGALVPFMLGIVAGTVRAQNLPAYRFGIPLALLAGGAALVWGPALAHAAASHAPPGTLRIDPLWSLALFGCLVAIGAIEPLERISRFAPLRMLGAASFATSLVAVPVTAFAVHQLIPKIGALGAAANAIVASLVVGLVLWKLVDRTFCESDLRRDVADTLAPKLSPWLARLHVDRVVLGVAPAAIVPEFEAETPQLEPSFYAPPPRPDAGDLAVVSRRTGSADELAAEIQATKKRLAERSLEIFADPKPVVAPTVYQKPGFYRKPQTKAISSSQAPPSVEEQPEPSYASPVPPAIPLLDTTPSGVRVDAAPAAGETGERSTIKMRIGASRPIVDENAHVERAEA